VPIAVSKVLSRTDDLLLDEDRVRWLLAERLRWVNDSMGAILNRRPAAFSITEVHSLVAGTKQTIPDGGSVLLDVVRNIASNGTTAGRVIRRTDRQLLDDADPDWHTKTAKAAIKNYTFDDRVPKVFYCYPPAIAGTKVEVMHAKLPTPVSEEGETGDIEIDGEYLEAVVNYVCYRCNLKDSEYASPAAAMAYYQAFEAALGVKSQAEVAASPNQVNNSV
jgi:hypothetical protein